MLRVLIDHQIFLMQKFGGISRYFVETARALKAQHKYIDISILAPYHQNRYLRESRDVKVGFHGEPCRDNTRFFKSNEVVTAAYNRLMRPHIVHETYYLSRRRYRPSQRLIITVYDMIHELFPSSFCPSDISNRKYTAVNRASHVIAISECTRRDLIHLFDVPADKVTTVHLGVRMADAKRKHYSVLGAGGPYVLYVGNRGGYKNFSTMTAAIAMSQIIRRETSLVCFGGPPFTSDEFGSFERLGLNLEKVHHLTGSDNTLTCLYANAAMLVYPSRYEGFGFPPLEAMQQYCPVVCSNAGSLPEVVGDAALMFNPNSAQQLCHLMEQVLLNSELRAQLIKRGRVRSQLFSWEKCAAETAEVYRRVTT